MSTNKVDVAAPTQTAPPAAPPPQASAVRLIVLLGILALVIGAYAYDYLIARPSCNAAFDKTQAFVDARNKMGVKDGALVTPADLHKELGMEPTWVDTHDDQQYMVEYYCWWGRVPRLNTQRHFISVVYYGQEPNWRFSSHHKNERPPDEALPIAENSVAQSDEPLPTPQSSTAAPSGAADKGPAKGTDAAPAETKEAASDPPAKEK